MEHDLTESARICLKHARASGPKAAAVLLRMAKQYQRRAALLRNGNLPRKRRQRERQLVTTARPNPSHPRD